MEKIYPVLIVIAGLILVYILWCLTEPFILDQDKVTLRKSSSDKSLNKGIIIKRLPMTDSNVNGKPDLRFFFFSDIHAEWCPVNASRLCSAIRKAHGSTPLDAVIFGGDLITYHKNSAMGYKYLNKVSKCCKELGIPFYGISGNHDWALEDAAGSAGFTSIDNKTVDLRSHEDGKRIVLAGISDTGRKHRVWQQMPVSSCEAPVILAVHDPDAFIHLDPSNRPDIMLSGHLHGGQMKFPFRIEFTVLRKHDKLPNMGAVQGVYDISGTTLFISRGLGCGILPFRFLSIPEATVVEIFV